MPRRRCSISVPSNSGSENLSISSSVLNSEWYVYVHVCMCVYACVYMCMCVYVCACVYVYVYVCICLRVCVCVCLCVCVCMYICMVMMGDFLLYAVITIVKLRNCFGPIAEL